MEKHFSKKSETQEFQNFGNLMCPLFEFLKFRLPGFLLIRNDEFMKIMKCPLFEFLKFKIPEFLKIKNDEFLKMMKSRRRGISWDSFCRRNYCKSLDMNLVSIKKHETKMW